MVVKCVVSLDLECRRLCSAVVLSNLTNILIKSYVIEVETLTGENFGKGHTVENYIIFDPKYN